MTRIGRLHVITDETLQSRFSHVELAALAAEGGAEVVQFREKRPRSTRELVETARRMAAVLAGTGVRLVVDDRVDVAVAAGVPAVHLGRDDVEISVARTILGSEAWIGAPANRGAEASQVARQPIDYLGVGPVFGTRTKKNPAPELGLDALRRIVVAVDLPVIAIGNIHAERIESVLDTGAHGVAVLSAVVCDPDPRAATRRIRQALEAFRASGVGRL